MNKLLYLLILLSAVAKAQIVNIPDPAFKAKLIALGVDTNNNGEIDENEGLPGTSLDVSGSGITDLTGIEHFTFVQTLNCSWNSIASLNLDATTIHNLDCRHNLITSFDASGMLLLQNLFISNNLLTTLNVSNNPFIAAVHCESNFLTSIDLSNNTNLSSLKLSDNLLTTLDVSNSPFLFDFECGNNHLTHIFMKNGRIETNVYLANNPDLVYVCADEDQIDAVTALVPATTVVGSYCSFTPGGNFNTIAGNIKYDANNNGCDSNDIVQPYVRVNINDGSTIGAAFTSIQGNYAFYTQAGSFDITPSLENPVWFVTNPVSATIPFADNNNNAANQDFCIVANGIHPDLEVTVSTVVPARPGFEATYQITYRNKGNQPYAQVVVGFQYDDALQDYISSSAIPQNVFPNGLSWVFTNLLPFESRTVMVTMYTNTPGDVPPVNIGDVFHFTATVDASGSDEMPEDNVFEYNQTVLGSYDPNNINCLEGAVVAVSAIGDYLHYAINFENTGTLSAQNVVVKTEIDPAKFDVNSLQLMNSSHIVDARVTGNTVEFIFKDIDLEIGGHGHILLKIKTNQALEVGDVVSGRADIFFDYNFSVDTGLANTTFQLLSKTVFENDDSVAVYPNPTADLVTIRAGHDIESVQVYDAQGRIITAKIANGREIKMDVSRYAKGIYFLKIYTAQGAKVQQLIKK